MLLYKVYFFVIALGMLHSLKRLRRLYIDGLQTYHRLVLSGKLLETVIALTVFVIHFVRLCSRLSDHALPADFRLLWLPEQAFFLWYVRGLADEKHYAAIEKALQKVFSAID